MQKLFKGGNYSRAETIWGNTVYYIMIKSSQKFWVVYVCYRIILEQCGGSDFWNSIIVKLMLHEIHQQSYILSDMSQLNPEYFWIRLTSLENTLMFIFKLEVNISCILFNLRTNGISHITFLEIWCRKNIIFQKKVKKVKKKFAPRGSWTGDLEIWRPVCWPLSYSATT